MLQKYKNKEDLEHVTRYFYNNKNQFKCINLPFLSEILVILEVL